MQFFVSLFIAILKLFMSSLMWERKIEPGKNTPVGVLSTVRGNTIF